MSHNARTPLAGGAHAKDSVMGMADKHIIADRPNDGNTPQEMDIEALAAEALDVAEPEPPASPELDEAAFGLDDYSNAELVMARYPDRFAYTSSHGWLSYDPELGYWTAEIDNAAAKQAIRETLAWRISQAWAGVKGDGETKRATAVTKACKPNAHRVNAVLDALKTLVFTTASDFQRDTAHLLNVANGVIDLRTGELLPHSPDHRFMYFVPTEYDPDADMSEWLSFLDEALGPEMADFIQVAAGYSITGHTREEVMFYVFGPTRAGKGTFTETLTATLGAPLVKVTAFETFTQRNADAQGFALAPLMQSRIVFASESNRYRKFDAAKVKGLTGGDTIQASFKRRDHFNYRPRFKIWLASNWPVNADPDDDAFWARVRVIEFPRSFLGREDKGLKYRLSQPEARRGVLRWLVEGARRYLADGLPDVESVRVATEAHRTQADTVRQFLDEQTEPAPGQAVPFADVYGAYRNWCEVNGITPKHGPQFSLALKQKGLAVVRKSERVGGKPRKVAYVLDIAVFDV